MLIERIRKDRMTAMKARDVITKTLMTTLLGELESVAKLTGEEITDAIVIKACKKFMAGNHEVITAGEKISVECPNLTAENVILDSFIPKQLTENELYAIIADIDATNLGTIMQYLKANHNGTYDGKLASNVANQILSK